MPLYTASLSVPGDTEKTNCQSDPSMAYPMYMVLENQLPAGGLAFIVMYLSSSEGSFLQHDLTPATPFLVPCTS